MGFARDAPLLAPELATGYGEAMVARFARIASLWVLGCTANGANSSGTPVTADAESPSTSEFAPSSAPESAPGGATEPDTGPTLEQFTSAAPTTETHGGGGDGGVAVSCDVRKLVCKRAEPACDYGFVPRIVDGCYGECVRIDECVCSGADACPQRERYTCNNSRQRCTPYLN